jgi:alpha-glucosidase
LRLRRDEAALGEGPLQWRDLDGTALAYRRTCEDGTAVTVVVNLGEPSLTFPAAWGSDVLLASGPSVATMTVDDDEPVLAIGPDTAVWLRG